VPTTCSDIDLDDMFGIRRALAGLGVDDHDRLLEEWRILTESQDYDVVAIGDAATRKATDRAGWDRSDDPVAHAWGLISDTTSRYLSWKRRPRRLLSLTTSA
jgi:hypothetical protein